MRKFLLPALLISCIVLFSGCSAPAPTIPGYTLQKEISTDTARTYWYSDGHVLLKLKIIDNVDSASATTIKQSDITRFEALFQNALSPYPGIISDEISCEDSLIPTVQQLTIATITYDYAKALLTSRYSYGVCSPDLASFEGLIAWAYCPGKQSYRQMEYIVPLHSPMPEPSKILAMMCL